MKLDKNMKNLRGVGLQAIAAGRIVVAGGTPGWVGAHPGFADAIVDNGAGDYTVTINASLAGYTGMALACSQTAGLMVDVTRASNTTLRITQRSDGGVLTDNGSIDVCLVTGQAVKGISGLYPVAAARVECATASVVGVAEFGGAHPGFATVTGGAGSGATGIYTCTINLDLTAATYFIVATSETTSLITSVVRTGANTFTARTISDAGAATESDIDIAIFGFQGIEGLEVVAAGRLMGADGTPAWDAAPHPGFGDTIADNGVGDYQVPLNHDLGTFTGIVVATVETAGGIFPSVVRTSVTSLQVVCLGHAGGAADADVDLIVVSA